MKLLTKSIQEQLLRNGRLRDELACEGKPEIDYIPVVKLFTPDSACTWLLTEVDPIEPDIGFGLCDLGQGFPELGTVSIKELLSVRGPMGLPIERDRHFNPSKTLSAYADEARAAGYINA
tara:strand:+ start:8780 stop:9139 length:360 start_codon:yes stop_codon:yes gene_type:complete